MMARSISVVRMSRATISVGGMETVFAGGSARGDQIYGSVTVSGGAVVSETVESGGTLAISSGATASNRC